jgi:hypothetical protein
MSLADQIAIALTVVFIDLWLSWIRRQVAFIREDRKRLAERARRRLEAVRRDEQRHAEWLRQTNGRGF